MTIPSWRVKEEASDLIGSSSIIRRYFNKVLPLPLGVPGIYHPPVITNDYPTLL